MYNSDSPKSVPLIDHSPIQIEFGEDREKVSVKICVLGPKQCGKSYFISQVCQDKGLGD